MVANMNKSCELEDMKIFTDFVLRMPLNRDCVNDRILRQIYKSPTFFSRPWRLMLRICLIHSHVIL